MAHAIQFPLFSPDCPFLPAPASSPDEVISLQRPIGIDAIGAGRQGAERRLVLFRNFYLLNERGLLPGGRDDRPEAGDDRRGGQDQ